MAKKLLRLTAAQALQQVAVLTGAEVDLVLRDGRTIHGYLSQLSAQDVKIADRSSKVHCCPWSAISEIIRSL